MSESTCGATGQGQRDLQPKEGSGLPNVKVRGRAWAITQRLLPPRLAQGTQEQDKAGAAGIVLVR